ncbi:MAG: DUF6364 family protein [Bacteroidales bacterium]|jgi:hypothetical protein|nr:DUF6364 family protein [Bacteroidales bacterium]
METKLTLRLNGKVIERAKIYASNQKISLSKLIEAYLDNLTRETTDIDKIPITPLVKDLGGVINLPADFDYKNEYSDFLNEKYK